jgi:6,7-dimethyl-8-ribityllumazine synthase
VREIRTLPEGRDLRISILVSRFNPEFGEHLLEGALRELRRLEVPEAGIEVIRVPGALELPAAARRCLEARKPDALVALGAVIRGETTHYEIVSSECAKGLLEASRDAGVPVAFGVLTTENEEQALDRAHPGRQDKGGEAARVAVEMACLFRELGRPAGGARG